MSRIFISYRRDDTAGHAGRLFDRLCARLGKDSVFMDVEGIEAGLDFVEAIEAAVGSCDVLLAVIGRAWLDIRDSQGRRRLDDPRDFIRLETATALARHIRVIPVLVEGAAMPTEELLPDILQPLARRQAVDLRDSRWEADIENLMQVLERVLAVPSARSPGVAAPVASGATSPTPVAAQPAGDSRSSRGRWLAATAALIVLGAAIAYFIGAGGPGKVPTATPVVASAAPTPAVEAKAPARPDAMPPAASAPAQPAAAAAPIAAAEPSAPRPAPAVGPSAPAAIAAAPLVREKSAPPKSGSPPARPPRLAPAPSAESPEVASKPAQLAKAPVQAPVPLPPVLPVTALKIAIVTMGETTSRSFWGGERVAAYGAKMAALYDGALRQQAPGKIEVQARSDGALAKPILDGSSRATQQVCDSTGASVIFAAHAQQAFSLSQLDSPYFPELRLGAIACASGKRLVSSYNMAPRNDEAFPFAQDMARAMSDFVREKLPQVQ